MSTEQEIIDEARRHNEKINREAYFKIQGINAAAYRNCEETARSIQEAKAKADRDQIDLERKGHQERLDLWNESLQTMSEIEANKTKFLAEQRREIQSAEAELKEFREKEELETQLANELEDKNLNDLRVSNQERLEQEEILRQIQSKDADEERDRQLAELLQKSENDRIKCDTENTDEVALARARLERRKKEELERQEQIKKTAEEKRKWRLPSMPSMPSMPRMFRRGNTEQTGILDNQVPKTKVDPPNQQRFVQDSSDLD